MEKISIIVPCYNEEEAMPIFYEEIIKNSSNYLNDKNIIAFEIGYLQANEIKKMAHKYYPNSNIIIEKDMQEKDRFVFIINL